MTSTPRRVRLLGVPMDCVSMRDAVAFADRMVADGSCGSILAINPEKIMSARENPELMAALEKSALLIPDGIGAVMAARLQGARGIGRVPGSDLMPELCGLARARGYGVFLFGARPEVNEEIARTLHLTYPGLRISGRHHGYVDHTENDALIDQINSSGAQILFVALGSPRQELWISRHLHRLTSINVCQGVGGTFDVLTGRLRRAPHAWRRAHLEWLYRTLQEPTRLRRVGSLARFAISIVRNPRVRAVER